MQLYLRNYKHAVKYISACSQKPAYSTDTIILWIRGILGHPIDAKISPKATSRDGTDNGV